MMKNAHKTKEKKRSPVKLVVLLVVLALVLTGLALAGREAYRYYKDANALVDHAEDLKTELKALVTHVVNTIPQTILLQKQKLL